jgi:hypothetical protein
MHAISADNQRQGLYAAVLELRLDCVTGVIERSQGIAVAHCDAGLSRAVGQDAFEILPSQINVFVIERVAHAFDRYVDIRCRWGSERSAKLR